MSLLTIAQSVCAEIGFPVPSVVATGVDELSVQILALANKELRQLSRQFNWPVLVKDGSIATVIGQETYALPADYRTMVTESAYNSADYWRMRGSMSPQDWQRRKYQQLTMIDRRAFRLYGNPTQMYINPLPTSVDTLAFEYITRYYAATNLGVAIPLYVSDTDVSLVDEDLVQMGLMWRLKHAKGIEFSADLSEYNASIAFEYAKTQANDAIEIGCSNVTPALGNGYVPDHGFGV